LQGAFFAVSDFGALWRIDSQLQRAQQIELSASMPRACGLSLGASRGWFFGLCVPGPQGGWSVKLGPDRRSGYVLARACKA
jgi:hypothetical protein